MPIQYWYHCTQLHGVASRNFALICITFSFSFIITLKRTQKPAACIESKNITFRLDVEYVLVYIEFSGLYHSVIKEPYFDCR